MNLFLKKSSIFYCLFIAIIACHKEEPHPLYNIRTRNRNPIRDTTVSDTTFRDTTSFYDTVLFRDTTFSFKSDNWIKYPYFGGPGEDSMFNCWSPVISELSQYNLISVFIKTKNGTLLEARRFINVSQSDWGYLYQPGESLNTPHKILLWWIQKQAFTTPDADSAFIKVML